MFSTLSAGFYTFMNPKGRCSTNEWCKSKREFGNAYFERRFIGMQLMEKGQTHIKHGRGVGQPGSDVGFGTMEYFFGMSNDGQ